MAGIIAAATKGEQVEVEGAIVSRMRRDDGMIEYAILTYTDTPEELDRIYLYDYAGAVTYCTEQLPALREVISNGVRQWVAETIESAFGNKPALHASNREAHNNFHKALHGEGVGAKAGGA